MKSDNPIPENPATERSGLLIRDLNADEKPREKANRFGMDALTDVELLALLLGSGVPGKSVLDLSREILQDNDNRLRLLSRMSIAELKKKYKGVGEAKATLLVAAMAFGSRVQASLSIEDPQMRSSEDVHAYMRAKVLGAASQQGKPCDLCRPCEQRRHFEHCRRHKTYCQERYRPPFIGNHPGSQPSIRHYDPIGA